VLTVFLCLRPRFPALLLQGHNAFIRKNLNHTTFSAEPGNLYNKHSYKHSGACAAVAAAERREQQRRVAGDAAPAATAAGWARHFV
jgi:hypothetical protein